MSGPWTIRRGLAPEQVGLEQLRTRFGCDVSATPPGVVVIAWDPQHETWLAGPPQNAVRTARLATLLAWFGQFCGPLRSECWWSLLCLDDAWPEGVPHDRLAAGAGSALSAAQPRLLAFGRPRDDDSVILLPDPHYVHSLGYLKLRALLPWEDRPWARKLPRAIYCGGQHGSVHSFERVPADGAANPRDRLDRLAQRTAAPLVVHLGEGITRSAQLRNRMVLDVDGFARTWDAWAWKTRSNSVVLSQTSVWESFFSLGFVAWEHFVPLANDLSDVEERISWCLAHDAEAQQIARRSTERAGEVYAAASVRRRVRADVEAAVLSTSG